MNLLVDIGNSRLKWATEHEGAIDPVNSLDYRKSEFLLRLQQSWQTMAPPNRVVIASVSGEPVLTAIIELSTRLWPNIALTQARSTKQAFGVTNAYECPEKLGIDRWLALIGTHNHYSGAFCVVDCGTAITVDVLEASGKHLGGLICPGLQMMKKALAVDTADLMLNAHAYGLGFATKTDEAIANGVLSAATGLIKNAIHDCGKGYRLILTGGDAEIVAASLSMSSILDKTLVLKGLAIVCSGALSE